MQIEAVHIKQINKRPKKNQPEYKLQIFMGFFLMACILGVSFRLYFSTDRVTHFLNEQIKKRQTHVKISFKSAEMSLADGIWPEIALNLKEIEVQLPQLNCPNSEKEERSPIRIGEAHIPLDILRLFRGEFALSQINIQKLELDAEVLGAKCELPKIAAQIENTNLPPSNLNEENHSQITPSSMPISNINKENKKLLSFWKEEQVNEILTFVRALKLDEVKLYFDHHQKFFEFREFQIYQPLTSSKLKLSTELSIPPEFTKGEILPQFSLSADLGAKEIQAYVDGHLSEGHIHAEAVFTPGEVSPDVKIHMQVKQLPLSSLGNYFKKTHLIPESADPHYVWTHFDAFMDGPLSQLKQAKVKFENLIVKGEFGELKIDEIERFPDASWSKFKMLIKKVSLQKAFDQFSYHGPEGIFSDFGVVDGEINFEDPKNLKMNLLWSNAKMRFSRFGHKADQKINRIEINTQEVQSKWFLEASNIEFEKMKPDAVIKAQFDSNFQDGEIELDSKKLVFDPEIQKIIFMGDWSSAQLHSNIIVSKSKIQSAKAQLNFEDYKSSEFKFKQLKLNSNFQNLKFDLQFKLPDAQITYNKEIRDWLKQALLGFEDLEPSLDIKNAQGQISVDTENWAIKNLKMYIPRTQTNLSAQVQLNAQDEFFGMCELNLPKYKKLVWNLGGIWPKLEWKAESQNLKQLIEHDADSKTLGLKTELDTHE